MTIEQLLEMSVDDIANLSDDQLRAELAPFFPLTRPKNFQAPVAQAHMAGMAPELRARLEELQSKPSLRQQLLNKK